MTAKELTRRELDCLALAARGLTGQAIAEMLEITERTVRFHIANACSKLGAERRAQAVAIAIDRGLIRL